MGLGVTKNSYNLNELEKLQMYKKLNIKNKFYLLIIQKKKENEKH